MLVTTTWLKEHYNRFNKDYWDGLLPDIKLCINRSKKYWGFARYKYDFFNDTIIPESITISNYYDSPEEVKIQTLLHEMIHIADYFWHPERFIKNGHKVTKRQYDAHGWWFKNEARRIEQKSGYVISPTITKDEISVSKYSEKTLRLIETKKNNSLVCALYGNNGKIWMFKTDKTKASYIKNIGVHNYGWEYTLNGINKIKFYTFDDDYLFSIRSCRNSYRGWLYEKNSFIERLKQIKAKEFKVD